MTVKGYIERIIYFQKKRDFASAYDVLKDAITLYPSNEFLLISEIYLLLKLRQLREAREKAEARLSLFRSNPFFLKTYIEILLKERDKEGLLSIAERLKVTPFRDEKFYIFLSDALIKSGYRDFAIELIQSGISYMPEKRELQRYLEGLMDGINEAGIEYYRERYRGMPHEKVISEIENILVLPEYGRNVSIRLFLAELYKKQGDLEKVQEVYSDCLKIKDSLFIRKMLGFVYYRMGDMDKAFFYLRDPFLNNPEDHAVYNTISKILEKIGDITKAEELVNEALTRHPKAGQVYGLMKRLRRLNNVRDG